MLKGLCWFALAVAGLMTLLFILDLATGVPFGQASVVLDIIAVLSGLLLMYLAIDTVIELR